MQVSIVACFLYDLSKGLVFVPVASALTGAHGDNLVVGSFVQQLEIQHLASQGQFISTDLL